MHRVVALHGWGQSNHIWFQQPLIHGINLPGHGGSVDIAYEDWLSALEKHIVDIAKQRPIVLMGWSLGGQLALALEQRLRPADIIKGLVLVSSTPCFRQKKHWQHGCTTEVWQGFTQASAQPDAKLMARFFHMMLHGDTLNRQTRSHLMKAAIDHHAPPSTQGLTAGLELLAHLDLRHDLHHIKIPTLIIHGQNDAIVPIQASHFLVETIATSHLLTLEDCGHAPFLTHHGEFNRILELWCQNISM